mmetsp:Transcript_18275/g.51723  ORF Transcript_18275/g.51723 Transcript_18275/m.51723 type:complete len:243 (-) Transcript_18275:49-777(-)
MPTAGHLQVESDASLIALPLQLHEEAYRAGKDQQSCHHVQRFAHQLVHARRLSFEAVGHTPEAVETYSDSRLGSMTTCRHGLHHLDLCACRLLGVRLPRALLGGRVLLGGHALLGGCAGFTGLTWRRTVAGVTYGLFWHRRPWQRILSWTLVSRGLLQGLVRALGRGNPAELHLDELSHLIVSSADVLLVLQLMLCQHRHQPLLQLWVLGFELECLLLCHDCFRWGRHSCHLMIMMWPCSRS